MPADLLQAFKATLEELEEADLLVHVIDFSNPAYQQHVRVVENLLAELDLGSIPCLKVFNKLDKINLVEEQQRTINKEGVGICALESATLKPLLLKAQQMMKKLIGSNHPAWR